MKFEPLPHDLGILLIQEAHSASPDEMCGFIVKLDDGLAFLPVPNCHKEPHSNFSMDEEVMLEILQDNHHKVLGVYHSHPKGNKAPSDNDISLMRLYRPHGFRFWIVTYNNVYEWELIDDEPYSIRRDGTAGIAGMAYPLLTAATAV